MTNEMIILNESIELMKNGILEGTGHYMTFTDAEGNKIEQEIPEPIHTYAHWQNLGFQVRKGEKAIAKFDIWKGVNQKSKMEGKNLKGEEVESEIDELKMFRKKAAFFKLSQVDLIKVEA